MITTTSSMSPVMTQPSATLSFSMDELMARQRPGPTALISAGSNILGSSPVANNVGRMFYMPGNSTQGPGMMPPGEQLMP